MDANEEYTARLSIYGDRFLKRASELLGEFYAGRTMYPEITLAHEFPLEAENE